MVFIAQDSFLRNMEREALEIATKLGQSDSYISTKPTLSKHPLNRSANKTHTTRKNWGEKEALIHSQNLKVKTYTFKSDITFISHQPDQRFFDRLRKQVKKQDLTFCLYRELTKEKKEHHHVIWQTKVTKKQVRDLFTLATMTDTRRTEERKAICFDIHHEEIDQDKLANLLVYNTKSTKQLADKLTLFPARTRNSKHYGNFYHKPKKQLWKDWVNETYKNPVT